MVKTYYVTNTGINAFSPGSTLMQIQDSHSEGTKIWDFPNFQIVEQTIRGDRVDEVVPGSELTFDQVHEMMKRLQGEEAKCE